MRRTSEIDNKFLLNQSSLNLATKSFTQNNRSDSRTEGTCCLYRETNVINYEKAANYLHLD